MTADAVRPDAPPLLFTEPLCPLCGRETERDPDGFLCDPCGAWWHRDGAFDEWVSPE